MRSAVPARICLARNSFRATDALRRVFLSERWITTTIPKLQEHTDAPFPRLPLRRVVVNSASRPALSSKRRSIDDPDQTPIPGVTKEIISANIRQLKDINPKDLEATLEAHRASNEAYAKRVAKSAPVNVGTRSRDANKRDLDKYNAEMMDAVSKRDNLKRAKGLTQSLSRSAGPDQVAFADAKPENASKANLSVRERRAARKSNPKGQPDKLDYEGTVMHPIIDTVIEERKLPWYITEGERRGVNGYERLNLEIQKFHEYVLPTPIHDAARAQVITDTRAKIQQFVAGVSSEVFGSVRTGLALATSDIDIRISQKDPPLGAQGHMAPRYWVRKSLTHSLGILHRRLLQEIVHHKRELGIQPPYMLVQYRHARYPLISMQHISSGLDVQIVCANDSESSRNHIALYLGTYPGLRAVYNTVKLMFDVRDFTDVYRGGLGSYSIFMMVAASFRLDPLAATNSPAQNLIQFFKFWGNLDLYTWGVSLEPPALFKKAHDKPKPSRSQDKKPRASSDAESELEKIYDGRAQIGSIDETQPYLMCLQDPADPMNDLGYKAFGIKHAMETIRHVGENLLLQIHLNTQDSLLAAVVGPAVPLQLSRRLKLEEYGREVMGHEIVPTIADAMQNEPDVEPDERALRIEKFAKSRRELKKERLIAAHQEPQLSRDAFEELKQKLVLSDAETSHPDRVEIDPVKWEVYEKKWRDWRREQPRTGSLGHYERNIFRRLIWYMREPRPPMKYDYSLQFEVKKMHWLSIKPNPSTAQSSVGTRILTDQSVFWEWWEPRPPTMTSQELEEKMAAKVQREKSLSKNLPDSQKRIYEQVKTTWIRLAVSEVRSRGDISDTGASVMTTSQFQSLSSNEYEANIAKSILDEKPEIPDSEDPEILDSEGPEIPNSETLDHPAAESTSPPTTP